MRAIISVLFYILVLSCTLKADLLKVAVINDIHYDPYYDESQGVEAFCRSNSPIDALKSSVSLESSPFGHLGCDSPKKLVDLVMSKMKNIQPDVDLILVSGDYLGHGFSVEYGSKDNYEILKQTLKYVFVDLLSSQFPNTVILPAIGNNDIKYHYKAPSQDDEAKDYYNFFADVLFNQVEGNKKLKLDLEKSVLTNSDDSTISDDKSGLKYPNWAQTFLQRGYFRYDHDFGPDGDGFYLSFLSFNTLYYNLKAPVKEPEIMKQQLDWIEEQLKNSEDDRKFIIYFHIYPGPYYIIKQTYMWDDDSTKRFSDIVDTYNKRILVLLGAHTHFADVRINMPSPKSSLEKVAKVVLLNTPSISPSFLNNPGFTLFKIENNKVKDLKFVLFELFRFPKNESEATFNTLDFNEEYGIDIVTPKKIQALIESFADDWKKLYNFIAHKIGYRGILAAIGVHIYYNIGSISFSSSKVFICSSKHFNKNDYQDCLNM